MPGKYELQPVLVLREKREDKMQQALQAARRRTVEAVAVVEKAKKALDEFMATKDERIDKLYAAVLNKVVKQERIDQLKAAVAAVYAEELNFRHSLEVAEENLEKCRQEEEKAHDDYVRATKNVMKLNEHREMWREQSTKEEEREEDKEAEEFTPISRIADDDDSLD